ncbi:MAG: hypothetical protein ACJ8F7_06940 [Gemmataceae bacterium]
MKPLVGVCLVLALLAAPGCRRGSVVKDEKTIEVEPGKLPILYVPASKKVQVEFVSTDGVPISAALLSKADGEATQAAEDGKIKGKKLAELLNTTSGALKTQSEAKTEYAAVFYGSKKASVKVTISGE